MTHCGYRTGVLRDGTRRNWANTGPRPIAWSAWYPCAASDRGNSPPPQFFDLGDVRENAPLAETAKHPVVLLSHGTGGTAESLGWLARALARQGYVVLGANHHGNTALAPYLPEGFLCWWERATDLSVLLSSLSDTRVFAGRLDLNRVSAVGFSLGAYAVLALAGARTSMQAFEAWTAETGQTATGPPEFPDLPDHIPRLMETSEVFRRSWEGHGTDFSDPHVKSVVALCPPPPVRAFLPQSVCRIETPVTLLTAGADQEAPSDICADWLLSLNARFQRHDLGADVGHYTFLEFPEDRSLIGQLDIFTDHPSVDRAKVHEKAVQQVLRGLP